VKGKIWRNVNHGGGETREIVSQVYIDRRRGGGGGGEVVVLLVQMFPMFPM